MDMKKYGEGNYINVAYVNKSPTKKLVFLNSGEVKMLDNKERVIFLVEIDQVRKNYCPNMASINNLNTVYGLESSNWVGKIAQLSIEKNTKGQDCIIARPQ